jgi:AcrR family transcriptional regulator
MSLDKSKEVDTRTRILDASGELFRRRGYSGTGLKAILAASDAAYGSLYYFFPGGKEELAAATLRAGGVSTGNWSRLFFPRAAMW